MRHLWILPATLQTWWANLGIPGYVDILGMARLNSKLMRSSSDRGLLFAGGFAMGTDEVDDVLLRGGGEVQPGPRTS